MMLALLLAAAAPMIGVLEFRDKVPEAQRLAPIFSSATVCPASGS